MPSKIVPPTPVVRTPELTPEQVAALTKFSDEAENEMVVTALSMDVATEPGRDDLPRIQSRFTARFKFGPIEPGK
jgi:hypothetical protein